MTNPTNDPRLDFAVLLRLAHPDWSIVKIARSAGGVCKMRVREQLVEEDLMRPKRHRPPELAAPDWYHRPCGRIAAQRQAHGITVVWRNG